MKKLLPVKSNEYYEFRLHSIGGQGAYTIGKMLSDITVLKNDSIQGTVFASYGSEKKGAPVETYIRFLEGNKITNFSAVVNPNVIVVFHEKLLDTIDVLKGAKEDAILIVNTDLTGNELVEKYDLKIADIVCVDATRIAIEEGSKTNTVMLGAIINKLEFLDKQSGIDKIRDLFAYRYPELIDANLAAYTRGYDEVTEYSVTPSTKEHKIRKNNLGYENQSEGGIIKGQNAFTVDRSISREGYLPAFHQENCINCTKCDTTCPDDCFVWEEKEGRRGRMEMVLQGIDYKACKGCLRCVEICPTTALETLIESREYADEHTVPRKRNEIK